MWELDNYRPIGESAPTYLSAEDFKHHMALGGGGVDFLFGGIASMAGGLMVRGVHEEGTCIGEYCPLHKPSEHEFVNYPMVFFNGHIWRVLEPENELAFIVDPDDLMFNLKGNIRLRNAVMCQKCAEVLVSLHRHDYRQCQCATAMVDGGSGEVFLRRTVENTKGVSLFLNRREVEQQLEKVNGWVARLDALRLSNGSQS